LIPGIASTYRVYAILLNRLAEHFQTIVYDYPGEHPDDGARLARITHGHLIDDLFGLIDCLNVGRPFLVGLSFGSTVALGALYREPGRFPRAALQGAFAHRRFSVAERWALQLGRLVPGTVKRLPFRGTVLSYNSRLEFPALFDDRWAFYLEQNGLTPIRALAHRVDLLTRLDLRPTLAAVPSQVLLIHGNEDRIVPARDLEVLKSGLPNAEAAVVPAAGHQLHLTHAEVLGQLARDWLLAGVDASAGCTRHGQGT
jgi:pimeloyl-ACP methyl ester carboxylesterase